MGFIPLKELEEVAFSNHKDNVLFKVDPRKNLHPYEILNFLPNKAIVLTLNKTAKNLKEQLQQYNFNTNKVTFIDTVSKKIDSPFEIENTIYLPILELSELTEELQKVINKMPFGPKFLFIDSVQDFMHHTSEDRVMKFIDFLSRRLGVLNTKIIFLAQHEKLTQKISKELFVNCSKVFEIPN